MQLRLIHSQLGLRNSTTRIPFRYGTACLRKCPQATMRVTIATDHGEQTGYSGDCLPPSWFDKNPSKGFSEQIDDMLGVIREAQNLYAEIFQKAVNFFDGWLEV